jgi:hypothetical protein
MAKGGREQRLDSSPNQQQEHDSTGGVAYVDRELTDEELVEVWQSTISGVKDGRIRMFDDKDTLIRSVLGRLGR